MLKKWYLPLGGLILCTALLLMACGHALAQAAVTLPMGSLSALEEARPLKHADSYQQVRSLLQTCAGSEMTKNEMAATGAAADGAAPESAATNTASDTARSEDYSGTNVQVSDVDEADVVKTDGRYLYAVYGDCLRILLADGANTRLLSEIKLGVSTETANVSAQELYLTGTTAAVLRTGYSWDDKGGGSTTDVVLLDVSDPAVPAVKATLGQDGWYQTSRLTDGVLYLITQYGTWFAVNETAQPDAYIPHIYNNAAAALVAPDCILLPEAPSDAQYTVVCSIDLAAGQRIDTRTVLDGVSTVYMTGSGLYLACAEYRTTQSDPYPENQYTVTAYHEADATRIFSFALEQGHLTPTAAGTVPGRLLNQFSLDAKDGYLRLVTTQDGQSYRIYEDKAYGWENYQWEDISQSNSLYILDDTLRVVGSITGLGADERIYSARFDGDRCYFVTFRETDPLFAADLSDPYAPAVLSQLHLPGFSQYLHVYGAGRLFGLGMSVDEATNRTDRLKLSMFNVSDPNAMAEITTLPLEDGYSEALNNHKALLILPEKNLIGIPAESGYLIFSYDDATGFTQQAALPLDGLNSWSMRGVYISGGLYVLSDNGVRVYAADSFAPLCSLNFAVEYRAVE